MAQDLMPHFVRQLIRDHMSGQADTDGYLVPLHVYVPPGVHPAPATACFLLAGNNLMVTSHLVLPIIGGDDRVEGGGIVALIAQHRTSGGYLTYPANLGPELPELTAAMTQLIEARFGGPLSSVEGLRQMAAQLAA